jgi:polar amino acid transport system substrate-binding protein
MAHEPDLSFARVRAAGRIVMGVEVEETGLCLRDADGQLDGFLIALGQGLAQGLGVLPVFIETPVNERMGELRDSRFDLLLSSPPMGPGALRLAMFTTAVARLEWRVLLPADLSRQGLGGVRGLRLAVPAGLTRHWVAAQLSWTGAELHPVPHWQTAQAAILAGICQGAVVTDLMAARMGRFLPGVAEGLTLGASLLAPSLRWGEHDLLRAVEMQLHLLRQRGILNILSQHYLGRPAPLEPSP